MGTRDKRVDTYIARSADFAQPILRALREIIHDGCPEIEEDIKWRSPTFMYKGILCGFAAFKQHCAFGFWKGSLIFDGKENLDAMGQFGRVTSMKDLPSRRVLLGYVKKARQLNDEGVKVRRKRKSAGEKEQLRIPTYFTAALKKNRKALTNFEAFSYTKKKDYVEWLTEAKTDETRARRLETSMEWIAQGKTRNWKYERC